MDFFLHLIFMLLCENYSINTILKIFTIILTQKLNVFKNNNVAYV